MTSRTSKTLKEIEMPRNCGLDALSQLTELKNISAFTLVHAARDNGLNLFVFKVNDLKDLTRVQRPCIFHQDDHFVYIKNGEPLPIGKYTGYVLGGAVLGRVIGLQEAKFIKGGKNFLTGKNKDGTKEGGGALGSILGVVGAIAGTILLPGLGTFAGASLGGIAAGAAGGAIGNAVTGDNALIGGLTGAASGFGIGSILGKGAAGLAAGSSALESSIPAAGSAGVNAGAAGIGTTFAAAPAVGSGFGAGINAFNAVNAANAGAGAMSLAGGGVGNASGQPISAYNAVNASNAGAGTPPMSLANGGGASNPFGAPNSVGSIPVGATSGLPSGNSITPALTQSAVNSGSSGGILGSIGNTASKAFSSNPFGTAATLAGGVGLLGSKSPAYNGASPSSNYNATSTFLGNTPQGGLNNAAGAAATQHNIDYVNTPISQLQQQFTANNTRTLNTINTAYDNQRNNLVHQYAQAGQTLASSQELQTKVGQLEQQRTNDLTLAQQEAQDQALTQAISVKQQSLSQSMQAGQFNQQIAMELAGLTGDQQNLQYAIANNDYQSFQQIMGKLLTMGIPQSTTIINNGQKTTVSSQGGG